MPANKDEDVPDSTCKPVLVEPAAFKDKDVSGSMGHPVLERANLWSVP